MKRGITLIEMLVAMSITLVIMAAVVTVFDSLGTSVANSRSTMEMSDRLRQTRNLLQDDLQSLSRAPTPWVEDFSGGYFEYVEGPIQDRDNLSTPADSRFGDFDDALMFTATRTDRPFQGRTVTASGVQAIESSSAEIVWYGVVNTSGAGAAQRTLFRRALLVAPWAAETTPAQIIPGDLTSLTLAQFQQKYDLSARLEGGKIVLNTLADLRLRENRFCHAAAFPHAMFAPTPLAAEREGEDIMLRGALAFDVRIFDPGAPIFSGGANLAFGPADLGYNNTNVTGGTTPVGFGAYVDLGYTELPCNRPSGAPLSVFRGAAFQSGVNVALSRTFDTWPSDYERDQASDTGSNGFDDDNDGVVDEPGERQTAAPYVTQPAGIQVHLRTYENDSRQIREVSVNHHFGK